MIRCVICDDISEIREYFRDIINAQGDMTVVGEAGSYKEAVELIETTNPDIAIMDIQMDTITAGIDATRIVTGSTDVKVIMLTIHQIDDMIVEAYLAGAVDYLFKEQGDDVICNTIRNVYNSENFMGKRIVEKIREHVTKQKQKETSVMFFVNNFSKLTDTERIILKYLYNGKKRNEIAEVECVSAETVKTHISHILRKLEFNRVNDMVKFLQKIRIFEDFDL